MFTAERLDKATLKVSYPGGHSYYKDGRGWSDRRVKRLLDSLNKEKEVKAKISNFARNTPSAQFGWAFLWGIIKLDGKRYKKILYSGCSADWCSIQEFAESLEEVESTWVNYD